jgi:probable HAF family extracellular repeat protein
MTARNKQILIIIIGRDRPKKGRMTAQFKPKFSAVKAACAFAFRQLARMRRTSLRTLALIMAGAPALALAQYSEIKMGEYLHYAVAAANGGVYAGIDGIGYTTIFGTPSVYEPGNGWVDLPGSMGFNTNSRYYGQPKGISHDGSVVASYMVGVVTNGTSIQYAAYWVNGVESLVPAPPDDPTPTLMSATGVSGDGRTLIVQDQNGSKTESYVFKIAGGTFTSLGFLGGANQQTYATAINNNGTIVAGYYNLDNGNTHGFIWNATNGMTDMGIPAGHPNTYYLEPTCISDDGTTAFGQLTEFNGWLGFRYNTTTGFQDLGGIVPSACTADGTEAAGIESMYFPAVWSVGNGGGYLDHLLSAHGTPQALGTTVGPVTISPDGSAITALGPDAYLTDQIWYGTWQVFLPVPLKTAAIPPAKLTFLTPCQETLSESAGTLIQSADFNNGVSAVLVTKPHYASSFTLNADGSFTYTPEPGYISSGSDPENGTPDDRFTYQLASTNGTSTNVVVEIAVAAPTIPRVDTPTATNVTATTATPGGTVESDGGAKITGVGVVYAPLAVDIYPQIGDGVASKATATATTGVFTVNVSGLTPGTDYSYAAYATNSVGVSYSATGIFTTLATPQSWQQTWFGDPPGSVAALNADPYQTGVQNIAVFAFLGPNQDPSMASVAQLPQAQISGGNLFYSFTEPDGVSGITYGAQWSAMLQPNGWQTIADTGDTSATPPLAFFQRPPGHQHTTLHAVDSDRSIARVIASKIITPHGGMALTCWQLRPGLLRVNP